MGLVSGDAPEMWNFEHPERVRKLHRQFIAAGADIILTNTFGGNRHRLKLHNEQGRVREINMAAAAHARAEAEASGRVVYVGGSMGPTGEIFMPVGTLPHEEGVSAFEEQAMALKEGGVDVLWIETMSSEEELRAAVEGAAKAGLPIVTTMSFDTNGRTMMGITPRLAPRRLASTQPVLAPIAVLASNWYYRSASAQHAGRTAKHCVFRTIKAIFTTVGGTTGFAASRWMQAPKLLAAAGTVQSIWPRCENHRATPAVQDIIDLVEQRLGPVSVLAKGIDTAAEGAAKRERRRGS
jgi:hypothetical protein